MKKTKLISFPSRILIGAHLRDQFAPIVRMCDKSTALTWSGFAADPATLIAILCKLTQQVKTNLTRLPQNSGVMKLRWTFRVLNKTRPFQLAKSSDHSRTNLFKTGWLIRIFPRWFWQYILKDQVTYTYALYHTNNCVCCPQTRHR